MMGLTSSCTCEWCDDRCEWTVSKVVQGLARCGTVFPMSAVVGAAITAAVGRWGLCPCCPGVGRCLSRVNNHHQVLSMMGLTSSCTCEWCKRTGVNTCRGNPNSG